MNTSLLQLSLEDLLADLQHARRQGDLGRLALIAYCEVRRWARQAGETEVAEHSAAIITDAPHANREAFLEQVDHLIAELMLARQRFDSAGPGALASPPASLPGRHAQGG